MKFGDYLRKKRESKSWTQPVAAEQIGIEQSYLSKLETGKSYPSEDIFDKLVDAYSIDCEALAQDVESVELDRLNDIKRVRIAVLGQHRRHEARTRRWMIGGLLSLAVGGASLGAAILPDATERTYHYRSEGILLPGEALESFDDIRSQDDARREAMLRRLNQDDQSFADYRGESFVQQSPEGRRFYQRFATREHNTLSHMRWFIIPALACCFASFGCFLVGFGGRTTR
ncbi:MAG: helix-turn-helix transcriptional regulator [Pseudomonadota bacterium]